MRYFYPTPARILLVFVAPLLSAGCGSSPENQAKNEKPLSRTSAGLPPPSELPLDSVLAQIGDHAITVRELQTQINQQSPYIRPRYTALAQKRKFLDSLIKFEVLAREAKKRGFAKDPEVIRAMKQVMIQKLIKDEFDKKLTPDSISDDALRAYYEAHRDEYNRPAEVRVMAVVVRDEDLAKAVAKSAKSEAGQTKKAFRELVQKHSIDDESKERSGDLQYFRADSPQIPPPVVKAAFQLYKSGDIVGPLAAGDGRFYIIKLAGKHKAVVKTFEKVRRQIKNRVYRETRNKAHADFVRQLREKAKVKILEENFAKVVVAPSLPAQAKKAGEFEAETASHGKH